MRELNLNDFSKELFSKNPVPGGGGASALVGALAASLVGMTANFTVGKKKYEEYFDDLERILEKGETLRLRLLDLIEEDAEGFGEIAKAYAMKPRDEEAFERALVCAVMPPLNMMKALAEVVELLEELLIKGSVLMISDVGTGAAFAEAAVRSAYLNVIINTNLMKDRDGADAYEAAANNLLTFADRALKVYREVADRLETE